MVRTAPRNTLPFALFGRWPVFLVNGEQWQVEAGEK